MLILRKKTIFSLILTAILLPAAAVCAETVEYDGLIEPHVVVTCLKCGKHTRIPLERKRKNVNAQDEAPNKT